MSYGLTSLLLDMVLFASAYILGISTGIYYMKKKMEKMTEDLMDGDFLEGLSGG